MKLLTVNRGLRALTLMEVLILVAVLSLAGTAYLLVVHKKKRDQTVRVHCLGNLKSIGFAFKIWAGDNGDQFPMQVSVTNGGTLEISTADVFRHFEVMSNELNSPRILFCSSETDPNKSRASSFSPVSARSGLRQFTSNSNVTYFVGLDALSEMPQTLLAGDRNLTNGVPVTGGLLQLTARDPGGWTRANHGTFGNVALADGSAQSLTTPTLQQAVIHSGLETNRLAMP